jgi:ubiquinone/menaquinone biosynthesis C-methylase UbiE
VTGIDFNRDILAIAEERAAEAGVKVTWVEGALEEADLPARAFDAILSVTCLQHITDRERQKRAIRAILGALKTDGVFVLLEDTLPEGTRPAPHMLAATQREWIDLVESQGGRLIDYAGVSFVRFRLRRVPARVCVAIDRVLGSIRALRGSARVTAFAFGVEA